MFPHELLNRRLPFGEHFAGVLADSGDLEGRSLGLQRQTELQFQSQGHVRLVDQVRLLAQFKELMVEQGSRGAVAANPEVENQNVGV